MPTRTVCERHRLLLVSGFLQGLDVGCEFFPVVTDGGLGAHCHVTLAGMHDEVAENDQTLLHECLVLVIHPCTDTISFDGGPKAVSAKNISDHPSPDGPPALIGGPAFEGEADIVLVRTLGYQGLDRGEMVPKPGEERAEAFGDHEIIVS